MDDPFGREHGCAYGYFDPGIVFEELRSPLQQEEPLVLVTVIMRRRPYPRRLNRGKHGVIAPRFGCTEMDDEFAAKSPDDFVVTWQHNAGGWDRLIAHFCGRSVGCES